MAANPGLRKMAIYILGICGIFLMGNLIAGFFSKKR